VTRHETVKPKSKLRPLFATHQRLFDTRMPSQLGGSCFSFLL